LAFFALWVAACSGGRQSLLPQSAAQSRAQKDSTAAGMCTVYAGYGTLSGCYEMDEASGTTLVDGSGAGSNGTIASSGVTYHAQGLTTNNAYAETTNGSTGAMTTGVSTASGSFSLSFFVDLLSNGGNYAHLAASGNPTGRSPSTGFSIDVNPNSTNAVYAKIGYGSGDVQTTGLPLSLNQPTNVTLTYNASTLLVTLCVGNSSSPACITSTLPSAYSSSGNPIVFGGGSQYFPANATFDNAGYWQGTVLTSAQIDAIAGYTGTPSSTPAPTPTPIPTQSSPASAMCSVYASDGTLSGCYEMDEASGTTLVDGSGAGKNGTITSSGVTYHVQGLTTNNAYAETTNGSSGAMTTGVSAASGSFSLSFFVDLLSNGDNYAHLAATGNPTSTTPSSGFSIDVNSNSSNGVFVKLGYGSGVLQIYGIPISLNQPTNVTLTYNASTLVATLCAGSTSSPTCVNGTLPSAYQASGNPIVFGGGSQYFPANATFDNVGYWQGTVLTAAQIGTIASYTGTPTSTPPTASPTPSSSATPALVDWPTYQFDEARDGYNPDTAGITPASLAHFHLAWQASMSEGEGQPIVATGVAGHTALVIVPAFDDVYAFDAFSGQQVWSTALPTQNEEPCGTGSIGGTAQYSKSLGAIFVVAGNGASPNHDVLYELNVATGSQMNSVDLTPTLIAGESTHNHTGVLKANGLLYVGTGSNCEGASSGGYPSWLGRLVAVNPSTMQIADTFYTTYGQGGNWGGGGIWSYGAASADANGNVYTSTGNAETNSAVKQTIPAPVATTTDEQAGYAEHLIKLTSNLQTVEDSNYPGFNFTIGYGDLDYTGVPVLFQPPGCNDLLTATQGKGGTLEINDTTALNPPVASYALSVPSGKAYYMGNAGYSPITGYLYAAIPSSGNGSLMLPPGMAAISSCGTSMAWNAQFGPDSASFSSLAVRSAPTVTAGGVVFMSSPCTSNGSGGCTTPGTLNGALWAIDASSGALLGSGGNPLLTTPDDMRMAPSADGLWIWVVDDSGNLYGYTVDPSVPTAALRAGKRVPQKDRYLGSD
jgi:hypothetical protein